MRKILFLCCLLFPIAGYGQSFTGNYRVVFFNLFSEPRTIIAEFEVQQNNSLNGKIKINEDVKTFSGTVDKKGNFEAVIEQTGNFTYKLKGKFDKSNKISLVQRNQTGSGFNKSVSESAIEGSFSKVDKTIEPPKTSPVVNLIDTGKSQLIVNQSNPLFGNEWNNFTPTVNLEFSENSVLQKIEFVENTDKIKRRISISTYSKDLFTKSWKLNGIDIGYASYEERDLVNGNKNTFSSTLDTYKNHPEYTGGTIEIIKENPTQIVFKLTNFKIKRLTKTDFVELNGFIYANKENKP